MSKVLLTSLFMAMSVLPAQAATFNVVVTESDFTPLPGPNPPMATLPPLGTVGTVDISLPGVSASETLPIGDPDDPLLAGIVSASVSVGSLTASLDPSFASIAFVSDTIIRFANGSFSSIAVNFPRDAGATPTYAGSFVLETPADGFVPTTFGDVVTALADPAATAFFSFNGTTFSGIDTSFRVDTAVPPVPLPAGGVLMLGGLGLLGGLRRAQRRRDAR